jgi:GT2 family glycosyltransferase
MENISIVIPTHSASDYLDLCLRSIEKNQVNPNNEIILVLDGPTPEVTKVALKFKNDSKLNIKAILLEDNKGFAFSTNIGFYNASNQFILTINDDNVCPKDFDEILLDNYLNDNMCLVPNQIEPRPSIFKPFIIHNFGEDTKEFDLDYFTEKELDFRKRILLNRTGWTLPIFISKNLFLSVGGLDVMYPGNHVSDWDFFVKLEKNGKYNYRTENCNFYHFGSKSVRTSESYMKEAEAHQFFQYKWGFPAYNRLLIEG